MAETKTTNRGASQRKTIDKWKKKKWFTVFSSKVFGKKPLGEIPSEKPKNLVGRTFKVTLDVVTGQRTKRDYKITFKINDIQGQNASTTISNFEVSKSTMGRNIRRRNSKVSLVKKIPVVNGEAIITVVVVTERKGTNAQKTSIRKIIDEQLNSLSGKDFELLVEELLLSNFSNELFKRSSKVCPIKKVIVSKAIFVGAK